MPLLTTGAGAYPAAAGASPLSIDGTPQFTNANPSTLLALPAFTTSNSNDVILVPVLSNGLPIISITGGGLTFARVPSFTPGANVDLWWAIAAAPLAGVVFTIDTTGNDFITAGVLAVTGGKTSAPFDATATAQTTSGTYATLTTSVANTFAIGFAANSAASPGSGWTNIQAANFLLVDYKILSATVSAQVFDTANNGASIVAAVVQGP